MRTLNGRRQIELDRSQLGNAFNRGKNWSPFVYKNNLFFVYSLSPLRVLRCSMPEGKLDWEFKADKENQIDIFYLPWRLFSLKLSLYLYISRKHIISLT